MTEVLTPRKKYDLKGGSMSGIGIGFMKEAIEESKKSISEDKRNHPNVGVVVVENDEIIERAHRGEIIGGHAEFVALKKLGDRNLDNATVYTTLEPCTYRNLPKISCAERLSKAKVGHVVIGMLDPNPSISGKGVRFLRRSGIRVSFFPDDLMKEVEQINKTFDNQFEQMKLAAQHQSINDVQIMLNQIYTGVNTKLSLEYLYSYLHRTTDDLIIKFARNTIESVNKIDPIDFIRPISWLFALATKLGFSLQNAYFSKYTTICPYCLKEICSCYFTGKQPDEVLDLATRTRKVRGANEIKKEITRKYDLIKERNVLGLDYATTQIAEVYPTNKFLWKTAGPLNHVLKLIEELAEVHESFSKFLKGQDAKNRYFAEELSDVLSWLISAWDIVFPNRSLDAEILEYYSKGCPICGNEKCSCHEYQGRSTNIVDLDSINMVVDELIKLSTFIDITIIKDMITSLNDAKKIQSDGIIRLCIREIYYQIELLEKNIKTTNPLYKDILRITQNISGIIYPIIDRDNLSVFYTPKA